MITGDSQAVADSVARRLGIDEVAAQVLPADKAAAVKRFQEGGRKVAMVGDGVNDAPALATADVGIAIGAGTDVAVESAGIVLVRSDPRDVVGAIELSRATYDKMVQNLVWATGYNLVAIPVADGRPRPVGHRPVDGGRCHRHEPLDDHRGRQCATPAPAATASRTSGRGTRLVTRVIAPLVKPIGDSDVPGKAPTNTRPAMGLSPHARGGAPRWSVMRRLGPRSINRAGLHARFRKSICDEAVQNRRRMSDRRYLNTT